MELSRLNSMDIILIAGLPGSGKSYFAREHFARANRSRINRKEIRKFLYEMSHFGESWKEAYFEEKNEYLVKHVERKILEQLLTNREKVLIDNISVTVSSRRQYIDIAAAYKRSIAIVFINTPVQECMKRNADRSDALPPMIISNLYSSLVLPDKKEGFREVLILPGSSNTP
jgi:predicted kinase